MAIFPEKKLETYWDYYEKYITPKLIEIDIMFKTGTEILTKSLTARLLDLLENEVEDIMAQKDITEINQSKFFEIMEDGSSELCEMFKNEVRCGMPYQYHMEDVAFIYGLDIGSVALAFSENKITEAVSKELAEVFSRIPIRSAYRLFK